MTNCFIIVLLIGAFIIPIFLILYGKSSKIEEYEQIIDDLIEFMDLKSYNNFAEYANYTKNGKSRYKWYTFCPFTKKRTFNLEKLNKKKGVFSTTPPKKEIRE